MKRLGVGRRREAASRAQCIRRAVKVLRLRLQRQTHSIQPSPKLGGHTPRRHAHEVDWWGWAHRPGHPQWHVTAPCGTDATRGSLGMNLLVLGGGYRNALPSVFAMNLELLWNKALIFAIAIRTSDTVKIHRINLTTRCCDITKVVTPLPTSPHLLLPTVILNWLPVLCYNPFHYNVCFLLSEK